MVETLDELIIRFLDATLVQNACNVNIFLAVRDNLVVLTVLQIEEKPGLFLHLMKIVISVPRFLKQCVSPTSDIRVCMQERSVAVPPGSRIQVLDTGQRRQG